MVLRVGSYTTNKWGPQKKSSCWNCWHFRCSSGKPWSVLPSRMTPSSNGVLGGVHGGKSRASDAFAP